MEKIFLKNYNNQRNKYSGDIKIVNKNDDILDSFENDMDLIDINHPDLKPENRLIINNKNFQIIFSCKYIKDYM